VPEQDTPEKQTSVPASAEGTPAAESRKTVREWLALGSRSFVLSEGKTFLLLAILIGIFSGVAVVFFSHDDRLDSPGSSGFETGPPSPP